MFFLSRSSGLALVLGSAVVLSGCAATSDNADSVEPEDAADAVEEVVPDHGKTVQQLQNRVNETYVLL